MITREERAAWLAMMEIKTELVIETSYRAKKARARQVLEEVFSELLEELKATWDELDRRDLPPGA